MAFKRLVGVDRCVFREMLSVLEVAAHAKRKSGRLFQLLMHLKTGQILQTAVAEQHQHDLTLAREQIKGLPLGMVWLADLGDQGLELAGATVLLPFKTPRHSSAKHFNQALARYPVKVEHRIRTLKVFAC